MIVSLNVAGMDGCIVDASSVAKVAKKMNDTMESLFYFDSRKFKKIVTDYSGRPINKQKLDD